MGYFKKFPTISYQGVDVQDILTAVLPSRLNVDKSYVFQDYTVPDGESAEGVAERMYRNSSLYWTLYVANSMVNPYIDWPMSSQVLEDFTDKKYGDRFGVHHFWDNEIDRIVDDYDESEYRAMDVEDLPFYIIPVTNLSYEIELNNAKRSIVVVNPRYVDQFVELYTDAVQGKT